MFHSLVIISRRSMTFYKKNDYSYVPSSTIYLFFDQRLFCCLSNVCFFLYILTESVIIFDDIDVISDKKIRDGVYALLNQVLEIGRHFKITCLMTNH